MKPIFDNQTDAELLDQYAAGDEAAAKATLFDLAPASGEAAIGDTLSAYYTDLVTTLMRHDGEAHLDKLRRWLDRAVELDEDNELAWFAKADIAFRVGHDDGCVRCLREARRCGAANEMIYQFVDIALQQRPTSKPLLDFSRRLAADLPGSARDAGPPPEFQPRPD